MEQKYLMMDYVEYHPSTNAKGEPIGNTEFGYVNGIHYGYNANRELELRYVISEYIGAHRGNIVLQSQIVRKAEPKGPDYGYREFLRDRIAICESQILDWQRQKRDCEKELGELK